MKRYAILHRSESEKGCQWHVNEWHRQREWGMDTDAGRISCGYHYLVLNPYPWKDAQWEFDGQIVPGRPLEREGAHCKGWNRHVGICYMGMAPTGGQMRSLLYLCWMLRSDGRIAGIYGHDEILARQGQPLKGCPGIDMNAFRRLLR